MSMASPAIISNFFEKQWTQNHPQYLSGLSRALYPTTFLKIAVYGGPHCKTEWPNGWIMEQLKTNKTSLWLGKTYILFLIYFLFTGHL